MNKIILLLLFFLVAGCGGASAPTSPAEIPTTISYNSLTYSGDVLVEMGSTATFTADGDCTNCEIILTDPLTGAKDLTFATELGTEIKNTVYWPGGRIDAAQQKVTLISRDPNIYSEGKIYLSIGNIP